MRTEKHCISCAAAAVHIFWREIGACAPQEDFFMNTDLTRGKPFKVLLIYILPLFGSAVFQQLYTLADTIIAGKFAGPTALTAIGASNSIVNILMAIALGANAGCAVLVSRLFGAKNNAGVKTAIFTGLISFAVLAVLLLVIGVCSCEPLLKALKTPQEALDESVAYLNIYYFGLPFLILYNLGTGIFSALGDSRTPFIFLVISSVSNIVLDIVMVRPWGVEGVAWATFIAQGASCILTIVFVFLRFKKMPSDEKFHVFVPSVLKTLLILALPVVLQNSFVSIGNLVIQIRINELANAQGLGITDGFTAGVKLLVFCTTCFCTCGTGLTNFVSQCYGAGKYKRIKEGFRAALVISTALTAVFVVICLVFARPLVGLFMSAEGDIELAIDSGVMFVTIVSPFFFIVNVKVMADDVVRGSGGNLGFTISTFTDLILRVALVFILTVPLGFAGVGWAWSIGWTLGMGVAVAFYFNIPCLKKLRREARLVNKVRNADTLARDYAANAEGVTAECAAQSYPSAAEGFAVAQDETNSDVLANSDVLKADEESSNKQ